MGNRIRCGLKCVEVLFFLFYFQDSQLMWSLRHALTCLATPCRKYWIRCFPDLVIYANTKYQWGQLIPSRDIYLIKESCNMIESLSSYSLRKSILPDITGLYRKIEINITFSLGTFHVTINDILKNSLKTPLFGQFWPFLPKGDFS